MSELHWKMTVEVHKILNIEFLLLVKAQVLFWIDVRFIIPHDNSFSTMK